MRTGSRKASDSIMRIERCAVLAGRESGDVADRSSDEFLGP
jgi:hypothetical protein